MTRADQRRLLRAARDRGWTVHRTNGSHLRLTHPNGAVVVTGTTPSDYRSGQNLKADLRRAERQTAG